MGAMSGGAAATAGTTILRDRAAPRAAFTTAALIVLVGGAVLLASAAAGGRTATVPAAHSSFPGWLRGAIPALSLRLPTAGVVALLLTMYAAYVAVVTWADVVRPRVLAAAIVAVTIVFALGPVLFSRDAMGYIGYARLGELHRLNPYAHGLAAAPHDAILPWIGWRRSPTPYGPLFTAATYPLALLPLSAALWAWKAIVVASALSCSAVLAVAARHRGLSGARAAAVFGLNPIVCAFGVGGAHNDLLLALLVAAALALALARRPAAGAIALAVAGAMKATTLVTLPFMALGVRPRRSVFLAALATGGAAVMLALLTFGTNVTGMLSALREEQRLVSTHSVPNVVGMALGLGGITPAMRIAAVAASAVVVLALLVWTARGADWIEASGWATLALLVGSAWLMTWYAIWVLPLAALSRRRSLAIASLCFGAALIALRLR
jgi:alpha-1,6-mannosyltransferase